MSLIDFMVSLLISILGSILGTLILQMLAQEKPAAMWHQQDALHQRTKKPLRVITPVGAFRLVDVCHQLISLSIVSLPKTEVKI